MEHSECHIAGVAQHATEASTAGVAARTAGMVVVYLERQTTSATQFADLGDHNPGWQALDSPAGLSRDACLLAFRRAVPPLAALVWNRPEAKIACARCWPVLPFAAVAKMRCAGTVIGTVLLVPAAGQIEL